MRRRDLVATVGSGAELAARQGLQFLVVLVLARILTPADFGKVALLALFVSFAVVVADLGINTALVQARSLTPADISTAFWVSVSAGGVLTLLGAVLAPPLANALGQPHLGPLAALMSVNVVLTSLGAVPAALLVKQLQFGRMLLIGVTASLTSGAVALMMALRHHGVWSLAVQSLLMAAISAAGAWLAVPQRPSRTWSRDSARQLLGTGRYVLAANMCDVAYARVVVLLIGTLFGPTRLGYYLRADSTQQMPADAASAVLGRVALPVFSEASEDTAGLRTGLRLSIRTATTVIAPALALAGALSGPLVRTFYGPQWGPSAPLLTILCLGGLLWPLHVMNIQLMYALGQARTVFRLDLMKKGFGLVAIGCGSLFGLHGVAWAAVVVGLFASVANGVVAGRDVGLDTLEQLRSVAAVIALAVGVAVCAGFVSYWWAAEPWVELVVLGVAGFAVYLGLARVLGVTAVLEAVALVRQVRERDRAW